MTQHLRIANAEFRPRKPGDFALTETAQDILRSLELMRHKPEPGVVMIAGAPGTGKTKALEFFASGLGHDAIDVPIASGIGTENGIADLLLRAFAIQGNGMSLVAKHETLSRYIGRGRAVILDECENLSAKAASSIASLAEMTGFDLVLCGGLDLQHQVNRVPALRSRVHASRPVIIKQASRADVACLVDGTAFATDAAIKLLHAVAQVRDGGLRNVEAAMHQATLFAGADRPTVEHLAWAIRDLKLAPKGMEQ
ncbi:MAG: AAA domain [Rhodobacteraceae bacterium HLUCCA12]|nr:MAG: AAA domain [Rhodobacteraceae bacterium HLUCCA12]